MEQDALIKNLHLEEGNDEYAYNHDDLEILRLGHLKSNILEKNPLFMQLRGKLVSFYQRLEKMKEDPEIKIDNLFNWKTLHESLKKLMRVVIITDDPGLQAQQLVRVFKWYNA